MRRRKTLGNFSFIFAKAIDHAQLLNNWRVDKANRECDRVASELAIFARSAHGCMVGAAAFLTSSNMMVIILVFLANEVPFYPEKNNDLAWDDQT
jgi:aspartate 1-decarboxylase